MGEKLGFKFPDSDLSDDEKEEITDRVKGGNMTFDDFLLQLDMLQKGAMIKNFIDKMGGGQNEKKQFEAAQQKLESFRKYVDQMDAEERGNPTLILDEAQALRKGGDAPRILRIAEATQASAEDVGRFALEFQVMR